MPLVEHPLGESTTEDLESAADHLSMHVSRMGPYSARPAPIVTRGGACYVWDSRIREGLSAVFAQVGNGRRELAEVAAQQTEEPATSRCGTTRTATHAAGRASRV